MRHRYTSATRTETWHLDGREWTCASLQLDSGFADTETAGGTNRIVASSSEPFATVGSADVHEILESVGRVAARATATIRAHRSRVESDGATHDAASGTISVSLRSPRKLSFTLDVRTAAIEIVPLLQFAAAVPCTAIDDREFPIVWRNGSGAVLLHEAIGHPSELAPDPLHWPAWLEVTDDPLARAIGAMHVDDVGCTTSRRVLSSGEQPSAHRRSGYRDAPLRRLTNIVVTHDDDPFDEPTPRIEVFFVGRGHYDSHRDRVELRIDVADLVRGSERIALAPFTFLAERSRIATRIRGARGATAAYPGVICSREGQRLPVGSFAPDILTDAFGR